MTIKKYNKKLNIIIIIIIIMIYDTLMNIPFVGLFIITSYLFLYWMTAHMYYLKYQLYSNYYR